jgi:hypothetical protein
LREYQQVRFISNFLHPEKTIIIQKEGSGHSFSKSGDIDMVFRAINFGVKKE